MINNFFLSYFVFLNLLIFFNFKNFQVLNIYDFQTKENFIKIKFALGGFIIIKFIIFLILFFWTLQ